MKKLSIASLIILSFIVFLTSWSFVESSLSRSAQLKILNSTDSTYTCSYYGNSDFKDDFYYMNKSLGLKYRGEKIIAEIEESEACLKLTDLAIGGRELAALGLEPSPEMGRVLNTLLDEVMEEKLENTKDSLINRAMQLKSR